MSFIPVELRCTAKKSDGTLVYPAYYMIWNGRIHRWFNANDRTAFHKMIATVVKNVTGQAFEGGNSHTTADPREMAALLAEYSGASVADDAIVAELKAIGADVDDMTPDPVPDES